ncbi:hypothetical protein ANTPLA_LOCUS10905 [Anthophora plagiata]
MSSKEESQFEEYKDKEERLESRNKGRKLWKTLDVPLADVDRDDNLYVAVRQNLHKVNRVSQSSLSPLKSSQEARDRSGVSQESSIGRFSKIKAIFDQDVGQMEVDRMRFECRTTMGKLMKMLGLGKKDTIGDKLDSMESMDKDLVINGNLVSK